MRFALTNCQIFTAHQILTGHSLIIDHGVILDIVADRDIEQEPQIVDLQGLLLAPGFIDTQVNGGAGVLLNNAPTLSSIVTIGQAHRAFGTTGFLATLISDDEQCMQQAINAGIDAQNTQLDGFLGLHLEGPFLSQIRRGVHSESKICKPAQRSLALLAQLKDIGTSMVTLAPEVVPQGFIQSLVNNGIIVNAGHTNANYETIKTSLKEGVRGFTHLYNAMSPLTSREPGVVGAALEDKNSWCGIIVDGHHVHPASLKIAINAKSKGKTLLVTDAIHSVGAQGDTFDLAGCKIYRENGRVTTAQGTLAGSDLDMASAVRNCVNLLELPLEEALRMGSLYPAQYLKLDHKLGAIKPGLQADLVLLDDQLQVQETWIKGRPNLL